MNDELPESLESGPVRFVQPFEVTLSGDVAYRPTIPTGPLTAEQQEAMSIAGSMLRIGDDPYVGGVGFLQALVGVAEPAGYQACTVKRTQKGARRLRGARITDRAGGVTYEVVAERSHGRPVLTYLAVLPHYGAAIDRFLRDSIPLADLARLAIEHIEGDSRGLRHGPAARSGERPSAQQVARIYRQAREAGGYPREELARRYGVSPYTVDNWLREARAAGVLEPAPRGRPPRKGSNR